MPRALLSLVDNKSAYSASSSLLKSIISYWDEDNHARILRKHRDCDRWDSVIAGLLITRDASQMTSIPASQLLWRREERTSKPYLYDAQHIRLPLCLSVTHEDGKIASLCAHDSLSKDIGIDMIGTARCIALASNETTLRGVSRKFTKEMQEDILQSPDIVTRGKKFGMYWSLLESIAKLNADGIHGEKTRSMFLTGRVSSISPLQLTVQQSKWSDIITSVFPSLMPDLAEFHESLVVSEPPVDVSVGGSLENSNCAQDRTATASTNTSDGEKQISELQTFAGDGWCAWSMQVRSPFDAIITVSIFT